MFQVTPPQTQGYHRLLMIRFNVISRIFKVNNYNLQGYILRLQVPLSPLRTTCSSQKIICQILWKKSFIIWRLFFEFFLLIYLFIAIKLDDADVKFRKYQIQGRFKDFIQFGQIQGLSRPWKWNNFFSRIFKVFQGCGSPETYFDHLVHCYH